MKSNRTYTWLSFLPLVFVLTWTFAIYQFPPAEIVEAVGTQNGYLTTLVLSFIGGISVLVGVPYHLVLMTFAAGGLNPFFLGIVASIGQAGGDSTSYLLGFSGRSIAPRSVFTVAEGFQRWCMRLPYWQFAGALFVYGAISPFSNDWLLIPMGLARYPYLRVMAPLELGNVVFNIGAGLLGTYGLASILGA